MKKLILSLIAACICVLSGGLQAQSTSSLPTVSTAEAPIWYNFTHAATGGCISIDAGVVIVEEQSDDNGSQMFRFEKTGEQYVIINQNGKYLSSVLSEGKVVLSTEVSTWILTLNTGFQAISISASAGGLRPVTGAATLTLAGAATDQQSYWDVKQIVEKLKEPIISDETKEVYYYILNQRGYPTPTKNAITDMATGLSPLDIPLKAAQVNATNQGQLWKFVMVDGVKTLKSKLGNYMSGFATNESTHTAIELLNGNGSPGAFQISTTGNVMHVGNDLTVSAWSSGPESYHVFVSEGDYWGVELKAKITAAQAIIASATVGNNVGQFTQASIDAFEAAVTAAKAVADNTSSTGAQITAAATALITAQNTFSASVTMPKVSTETESTWYYIRSTFKGYSVMKEAYAFTRTEDNSIRLSVAATGDAYLWRLKATANGTYILENKVKAGSIQTSKPPVISEESMNEWTITFLGNGQFTLTGNGVEAHADQSGIMVHWNASPIANSASCWTFIEPLVDKVTLLASITTANTLKSAAVIGTKGGQYTQEAVTAFETAITQAQAAYDNPALSLEQFFIESTALTTAITTFRAAIIPAIDIPVENIAGKAYRLKYIGAGINSGKYVTNPRTDSENDVTATGGRPQARFTDVTDATTSFKFMGSTASSLNFTIHNDRGVSGLNGGGDYMDEYGRMRPASAFDDTQWQWYTLKSEEATLTTGTKVGLFANFSAKYLTARADTAIVTMSPDSNPVLCFVIEEVGPASVDEASNSSIRVTVVNNKIAIYGTETKEFELITLNGARINQNATLSKGVYFVRIDGKAFKVAVK